MDNFTRLQELAAEDPGLVIALLTMLQEQAPEFHANLNNAIAQQDAPALKTTAHTYKGVLLNLGFTTLGQLCQELETASVTAGNTEDFAAAAQIVAALQTSYTALHPQLVQYLAELA